MIELLIIKYLLNLEHYGRYRQYIKLKDEDKELKNLYGVLDHLINSYERNISLEEYKLAVLDGFPDYTSYLTQIETSDVQEDLLSDLTKKLVEKSIAYDLALLSIDVSEGRKEFSYVQDFYEQHLKEKVTIDEVEYVTDDLEELWNETVHKPGLRWRLDSLNKSLGSLRKGDFGFLFARPETGKTTFLASEITFFAEQVDRPILWFNNEEQGSKVKARCYQAALGLTSVELFSNRPKNQQLYFEKTKGLIKIYDSGSISKRQVEKIVREVNPALIVFDQIDKIKGFDADRNDLRLGAIYIWARELAKEYCPVIGVCQSDVSGENKKWLTMDNVAEAKTSKQAEADWILGIGKTHDMGMEYVRYLHLSKNKLSGDEDTDPTMRHGRMEVLIKPEVARYGDY